MLLLKDLRKKIADKNSVPPYVIFQDPSLIEMTLKFPVKIDELSSIFGVGEGKLKKYGKEFIELISKYVVENNISRPDDFVIKSSGKNSSLKLFIIQSIDRKLSLDDIADSKSMDMMDFIKEMEWRDMIHDVTPGLHEILKTGLTSAYVGFDPTATSLHIGNLVPIMLLVHYQRCGHKPIALVGGATGLIGDPSGKSAERNLLTVEEINYNISLIKPQLELFLDLEFLFKSN